MTGSGMGRVCFPSRVDAVVSHIRQLIEHFRVCTREAVLDHVSLRQKAVNAWMLMAAGEGAVYGAAFLRNVILARVLTKADFGIAASFALVVTLFEFSAKLGIAQFVIRDEDGDSPRFIAAAHLLQFSAALLSATAIVVTAEPLSVLFGVPQHRWAIILLALIPAFRGLEHLDVRRFERDLRFAPSLVVEALPQLLATVACWPLAVWLGDFRAVLALLLVKSAASVIASHLVAEHSYRWRIDPPEQKRMLRFGWPLVVNGLLMFAILQGDQFAIAASYTMSDLAPYAAAAALASAPTFLFARIFNSVALPVLAKCQNDPPLFLQRYRKVLAVVTAFSGVGAIMMIVGGEAVVRLVYGSKYAGAGILLGCLAAANAYRTLRIAPALAAIARGDSRNQMIGNLVRAVSLVVALPLVAAKQPLWTVACTGLAGEVFACWISFVRLERRDAVPMSSSLAHAAWVTLGVGAAGAFALLGFHRLPPSTALLLTMACSAVYSVILGTVLPDLRREVTSIYGRISTAAFIRLPAGARRI